jgi:transcriptional regulator with GAF, ATPase, and Fis domain
MKSFESFLADVSHRLLSVGVSDFDQVAETVLAGLVELFDTDRASLQHVERDGLHVRASWGRPGLVERRAPDAITLPFHWYAGELSAGRDVILNTIPGDLPSGAVPERRYTLAIGMKALLTVRLDIGGRLAWSLSTSSFRSARAWTEDEVLRLRSVGALLASAGERVMLAQDVSQRLAQIEELKSRLRVETDNRRGGDHGEHDWEEVVGNSPPLLSVLAMIDSVAPTSSTVLLLGETGTGKELMARVIHGRSPRRDGPLVAINCAAIPATLIESELFGHEKGAFTGALTARAGRFEMAHGGTLFLDEIGDLPSEIQIKLLRVLQRREFERLGSTRTLNVNVRLIAATHRDLEAEVRAGRFRSDLFYRLNVFPIRLPPLRERPEDIPLLLWSFVEKLQSTMGRHIRSVLEKDLTRLRAYSWPGNVRELENLVERALILSTDGTLALAAAFGSDPTAPGTFEVPLRLEDVDRRHIAAVLQESGGRIAGPGNAAERLGLHPNTLRSRMEKLGIGKRRTTPPR